MNRDRFLRVKELFRDALPLDGAARESFLARACESDDALRDEVLELLAHAASAGTAFLQGARVPEGAEAGHPQLEIPGFRILEHITAGSAGVVYRARQLAPPREVALKVLRLDSLGPGQVVRFRREAEILAALNHPGIAQVYGAGVVEGGTLALPWIAMEFVHGLPLDEYVSDRGPDTRAVLELFRELCEAVDHAHERGIVHRDLKPSNVLVESNGRPRVLDFGVARMRGAGDERQAQHTRTGMVVGTLSTMAPEQARGDQLAIDARADVYALGVMLYEAFVGRPPLEVDHLDVLEAVQVVCTVEPQRLSRARRDLPIDLDAIVGKALEKEPERRYARAGELAADLANLLANRPVRARPPTTIDYAVKFVRRNRGVTIAVSLIVASLTTALVVALAALRNQARQRAITSETVDFLADRMLELTPHLGFGEEQRADLEAVVVRIERQLDADPESRVMRSALAQTLYELASLDQARSDLVPMRARLETARSIRAELVREVPTDTGSWTHLSAICAKLGEAARDLGDAAQCDAWFARALEIDEQLVREHPDDPEFLEDLGWSLARVAAIATERDERAVAEPLSRRRLDDAIRLEQRDPDNWKFVYNLSDAHHVMAEACKVAGESERELEHAIECVRLARHLRELDPGRRDFVSWVAHASRCAAGALRVRGRVVEARAHAAAALDAAEELALVDPRRTAHLDLLRALASEFASTDLGGEARERRARAAGSLRRVAEVAARTGSTSRASDLSATADWIEAGTARD